MSDGNSLRKSGPIGMAGNGSNGKRASETPMLGNTSARELPAHNSATNEQTKHINGNKPNFGELGGRGMGGAA